MLLKLFSKIILTGKITGIQKILRKTLFVANNINKLSTTAKNKFPPFAINNVLRKNNMKSVLTLYLQLSIKE